MFIKLQDAFYVLVSLVLFAAFQPYMQLMKMALYKKADIMCSVHNVGPGWPNIPN